MARYPKFMPRRLQKCGRPFQHFSLLLQRVNVRLTVELNLLRLTRTTGTRTLGVFLPTIALLLSGVPSAVLSQSVAQLLLYATSSPSAFKEATAKLEPPTRELLEQSVRRAVGAGSASTTAQSAVKPQISLRSF